MVALSVLIIDDHRDSADSLADLLRICGHDVRIAYDPEGALVAEPTDVVILELRLPKMNGWELVRRLRAAGKRPVFVAVTTCGQESDRRKSEEVGIHHHLVKPVEPGVLIDLLQRIARRVAS